MGRLPGLTELKLRSQREKTWSHGLDVQTFPLGSQVLFLLRFFIESELSELCRILYLSLAAPQWSCKAPRSLSVVHFQEKPRALLQFITHLLPSPDVDFPASTLHNPHQISKVRSPVYCSLQSLFTIGQAACAPLGWVRLTEEWYGVGNKRNVLSLFPWDVISVVPTVCFHCTVDTRALASVRTEFG